MKHECAWDVSMKGFCAICTCGWKTEYMSNEWLVEWLALDHYEQMKKEESMSEVKVLEMETDGDSSTIISNAIFLDGSPSWEKENLKPNTKYACVMIPLPEGYRLATDEDKKGDAVGVKYKSGLGTGNWSNIIDPTWYEGGIYAVPIETPQDAKVKELQQKLKDAEEQVKAVRKEMRGLK